MAKTKEIDLEKVEELASLGLSEQQIADSLGISRSTLSRRKNDNETFDTALRKEKMPPFRGRKQEAHFVICLCILPIASLIIL